MTEFAPSRTKTFDENRQERQEFCRLTIGIDMGIQRNAKTDKREIYVYEINGNNSGNYELTPHYRQRINKYAESKEYRKLRGEINSDVIDIVSNWNDFQALRSIYKIVSDVHLDGYLEWREEWAKKYPEEVSKIDHILVKATNVPIYADANVNPFLTELMTRDKSYAMKHVVPKELQPKTWEPGVTTESTNGWWIMKPIYGYQGKGIKIISDKKLQYLVERNPKALEGYLVQEMIKSLIRKGSGKIYPRMMKTVFDVVGYKHKDGTYSYDLIDRTMTYGILSTKWLPRPGVPKWARQTRYTLEERDDFSYAEVELMQSCADKVLQEVLRFTDENRI
jgi:hypothetical protein